MTKFQIVGLAALPLLISAQTDSGRIVVAEPSGKATEIVMPAAAPATAREDVDAARGDDTVVVAGGGSLLEAVTAVIGQLPDKVLNLELLGEEEAAQLAAATNRWAGTGGKRIPWNKALEEVLRPAKLFIFEDGVVVKLGTREQVDALYAAQQAERLANNHTRIDPDFSGGTEIYVALSTIRTLAGVNMNFDYMAPEHRGIVQAAATEQAAEGQVQVAAQPPPGVRTTYAVPPGQKIEWRIVLKEVLDPIGYVFIEDNGTVKPMPTAQLAKFNQDKINARPLVTKFVRVHHAKPDTLLEKLKRMELIRHTRGFIDVNQAKDEKAKIFRGQSGGIATGSSGQQLGAQIQSSSSSFSSLERKSTPPGLIVADIAENIPVIENAIKMLDIRERQVLIEALILDLSEGTAMELGVKWGDIGISYNSQMAMNRPGEFMVVEEGTGRITWQTTQTSDGQTITLNKPVTESRIPQAGDLNAPFNLADYAGKIAKDRFSMVPFSFDAVLRMVQGDKFSRLLSNPTLTVGDHCEAAIQVGTVTPVEQRSVNYVGSGSQSPIAAESVEWLSLQTGIMLWVSPEISEGGRFVRLAVHPQITAPTREVTAVNGEKNYEVSTQELDTRVTIPSGETLMLGGLIRPKTEKVVSKVPLLGDIPFLGRLFRHTGTSTESRHLVILIRPTILDEEIPDTGYEQPSLKVAEPMLKGIGKTLTPGYGAYQPEEKEKALLGLKKKIDESLDPQNARSTSGARDVMDSVERPADELPVYQSVPAAEVPARDAEAVPDDGSAAAQGQQAPAADEPPALPAAPAAPAAGDQRDAPLVVPSDK